MEVKNKSLSDLCSEILGYDKEIEKLKQKINKLKEEKEEIDAKRDSKVNTLVSAASKKYGEGQNLELEDYEIKFKESTAVDDSEFNKKEIDQLPAEFIRVTKALNKDAVRKDYFDNGKVLNKELESHNIKIGSSYNLEIIVK